VISSCCLGIGVFFALLGYWPVLPFAGLEVIVLGIAFHCCQWRGQWREVVTVSDEVVSVEKGRQQPQERWECPRAWARVVLERAPIAWYPRRLTVAFQGRRVEIGEFLNEEERSVLADELQHVIHDSRRHHPAG